MFIKFIKATFTVVEVRKALERLEGVSVFFKNGCLIVKQDLSAMMKRLKESGSKKIPRDQTIHHASTVKKIGRVSGVSDIVGDLKYVKIKHSDTCLYVICEYDPNKVLVMDRVRELPYRKLSSSSRDELRDFIIRYCKLNNFEIHVGDIEMIGRNGLVLAKLFLSSRTIESFARGLEEFAKRNHFDNSVYIENKPYYRPGDSKVRCYLRVCAVE